LETIPGSGQNAGYQCGLVINRWQGNDGELLDLSERWGFYPEDSFSADLARAYMQGLILSPPCLRCVVHQRILHRIKVVSEGKEFCHMRKGGTARRLLLLHLLL
jgi:hypothetical protein